MTELVGRICDHHYDPLGGCEGTYDESGVCGQCGRPPLSSRTTVRISIPLDEIDPLLSFLDSEAFALGMTREDYVVSVLRLHDAATRKYLSGEGPRPVTLPYVPFLEPQRPRAPSGETLILRQSTGEDGAVLHAIYEANEKGRHETGVPVFHCYAASNSSALALFERWALRHPDRFKVDVYYVAVRVRQPKPEPDGGQIHA